MHALLLLDLFCFRHYLLTYLSGGWGLSLPSFPTPYSTHMHLSHLPIILKAIVYAWWKRSSVFALFLLCKHYSGWNQLADFAYFYFSALFFSPWVNYCHFYICLVSTNLWLIQPHILPVTYISSPKVQTSVNLVSFLFWDLSCQGFCPASVWASCSLCLAGFLRSPFVFLCVSPHLSVYHVFLFLVYPLILVEHHLQ